MDQAKNTRVWEIWDAGQTDPQYRAMLAEIRVLEKRYDAVLQTMPVEQRDVICDYVALCEEMSWRMLEIACGNKKTPGV